MVNFSKITYSDYPYKHLVIDDFFNDSDIYKKIWNSDGSANSNFNIEQFKLDFNETVFPLILKNIEKHFGEVDMTSYIENINVKNDTYDSIGADYLNTLSIDGLARESHIDGNNKKYPMLIYFDDGSGMEGISEFAGSFQLMNWKNPSEVLKTVKFKTNRALIFEASCISYHRYWLRPKNRLNLNIPIVNNKDNWELTEHYKNT